MAEFEFILSENEQSEVLGFIEKTGAGFVPCIGYDDGAFEVITSGSKALLMWKEANMAGPVGPIFIVWRDISTNPFGHDAIEKHNSTLYYPAQGEGGPYIDFLPSEAKTDGGQTILSNGLVGYCPEYWISELQATIPVPDSIKNKYKEITSHIRTMTTRLTTEERKRGYWVGREAVKMLLSGVRTNVAGLVLPESQSV